MTSDHNYFEFLCALAASDELTGPERIELRDHSLECAPCRNRMNACLVLSRGINHRNGRLPEGMRERFIARAIKEGIPLTSPAAVGLGNLGVASALFIILLVTAAAIRTGPFSRPVVDAGHFDAAQYTKTVHAVNPTELASTMNLLPRRKDRGRAKSRSVQVQWRLDSLRALPGHLEAFQNHYVPAAMSSPHYLLAALPPDVGGLSSWPYMPSKFRLAVRPAANSTIIPSEFTFATPAAPGFHPALDPNFEFRDASLTFHFVENVTQ
jgi:hypothetical protein